MLHITSRTLILYLFTTPLSVMYEHMPGSSSWRGINLKIPGSTALHTLAACLYAIYDLSQSASTGYWGSLPAFVYLIYTTSTDAPSLGIISSIRGLIQQCNPLAMQNRRFSLNAYRILQIIVSFKIYLFLPFFPNGDLAFVGTGLACPTSLMWLKSRVLDGKPAWQEAHLNWMFGQ
jgi:hypothetical protein